MSANPHVNAVLTPFDPTAAPMARVGQRRMRSDELSASARSNAPNKATDAEVGAEVVVELQEAAALLHAPAAAGVGAAPLWFAHALQQALQPLLNGQSTMQAQLANSRIRALNQRNVPAGPLRLLHVERGGGPVPVGMIPPLPLNGRLRFPNPFSVDFVRNLSLHADLDAFHAVYQDPSLAHNDGMSVGDRRKALEDFLTT